MDLDLAYSFMRIPKDYWGEDVKIQRIPNKTLKAELTEYVMHPNDAVDGGKSFWFYGACGTGKSAAAACILKAFYRIYKHMGFWIKADAVASAFYDGTMFNATVGETLKDHLMFCKMLVVDEMLRFDQDRRVNALESLLRHRVEQRLPTIVTSNYLQAIADSHPSLIHGLEGRYVPIEFSGINWRKQKPEQEYDEIFSD